MFKHRDGVDLDNKIFCSIYLILFRNPKFRPLTFEPTCNNSIVIISNYQLLQTILICELTNELVTLNRYKLYNDVCNALWKYNLLHVYHIIAVNLTMKCVTQFSPRKR